MVWRWFWNILIALDQLGNAVLGGDPDETISSRAVKNRHTLIWGLLVKILDTLDPGHSARSIEEDEGDNTRLKLDKYLLKMCDKHRLIELIRDFVLFDGQKKLITQKASVFTERQPDPRAR